MSAENKTVEQTGLTEEQIQAKVKEIQAAVEIFVRDHPLYKEGPENGEAIKDYVESHNLDWTSAESYRTAYVELSKEGKLTLYEESKLAPPEPPKVKDELPGASIAVLADQQKARKTVQGAGSASSRDAFIKAAERFRNQQVPGGRLRLG